MGRTYTKMLFTIYLKFKFLFSVYIFIWRLLLWPTQTAKVGGILRIWGSGWWFYNMPEDHFGRGLVGILFVNWCLQKGHEMRFLSWTRFYHLYEPNQLSLGTCARKQVPESLQGWAHCFQPPLLHPPDITMLEVHIDPLGSSCVCLVLFI